MSDLAARLMESVISVTKDWAKQRKAEERHAEALANREARLTRASDYYNFKSAAFEIMEEAYMKASANGTLPANARQIMYKARPFIQDMMNGQPLNDQYFCQTLLPDYIEEHGVDWDVTYDDRGHFTEPHTVHQIGVGTIAVRNYLSEVHPPRINEPGFDPGGIETHGPDGCYGAVQFTEKEGFEPLFKAVRLRERYDIAPMSTKGVSVTAARELIDKLSKWHIPLLVLHDFDKSGFSIIGTFKRATRRYRFENKVKVIDLGLRLTDVRALNLEDSAEEAFDRGSESVRFANLRMNGATVEEAKFLLKRRVELNALTSDQLVAFIEGKLAEHGIKKIVPKTDLLGDAYRHFVRSKRMQEIVENAIEEMDEQDIALPTNLSDRVAAHLKQHPELRWDEAVEAIAENDLGEGI
jgi:hypothetical protein